MQLEIVRALAEAVRHPETGVTAQLVDLPVTQDDDKPVKVEIIDGSEDVDVAAGTLPISGEVMLLVTADGPSTTEDGGVKGEYSYATTPMAFLVVHGGAVNNAQKRRQAWSVLRATVLALKAYFSRRQDARETNQVVLLRTTHLTYGLVDRDGVGAIGAVVLGVQSLDKRAQRTV